MDKDTRLVDTHLSVRALNVLKRHDLVDLTIAELARSESPRSFKGLRGCGQNTLMEMHDLIERVGLDWWDEYGSAKRRGSNERAVHARLDIIERKLNEMLEELSAMRRAK